MTILVEACVDSVASAVAAQRGGAGRLELCDALYDGGTTPSAGMIAAVKAAVDIPVFVLVRPRGGSFVYDDREIAVMRLDIEAARMLGADGVVAGVLTADDQVDGRRLRTLVDAAAPLPVTFHRAFDRSRNQGVALEALRDAGVSRVLTSGGAATAHQGVAAIADLVRRAAGHIAIMAGGGIREDNVQSVIRQTGVKEIHVRGTRLTGNGGPADGAIRLRKPLPAGESAWEETDETRIAEFVRLARAR